MKSDSPGTRWMSVTLLTLAALCWSAAQAGMLYVFGDSLSDVGNNAIAIGIDAGQVVHDAHVPAQPYASGTYSNGKVWVSWFAAALGLHDGDVPSRAPLYGGNFAHGGARTSVDGANGFPPGTASQLESFLARRSKIRPDDLFVIAVGGNDVRAAATAVAGDPANAAGIIGAAAVAYAAGVQQMIDKLQQRGARNILVWNAPDLGLTPLARVAGPATAGLLSSISGALNSALEAELEDETGVRQFDVSATLHAIIENPARYGFTNVTQAAGGAPGTSPSSYLFWDGIHPSAAGHKVLARAVLEAWSQSCRHRSHDWHRHARWDDRHHGKECEFDRRPGHHERDKHSHGHSHHGGDKRSHEHSHHDGGKRSHEHPHHSGPAAGRYGFQRLADR